MSIEAAFDRAYGRPPEGVWAAPGRVNLIGEHTDYNDGFVLPFALPQRVVAAVARRDDDVLVARSAQMPDDAIVVPLRDLAPGAVDGWGAYVAGAVWAVAGEGVALPGLEILVDGDVPRGAGLSSSAALECAVVTALSDLLGLNLPLVRQAQLGQRAENDFVGAPTGMLDQLASVFGQEGAATFIDCRDLGVETVPLDLNGAGLQVLILDTRVNHAHTESGYGERRRDCEKAAEILGVRALRDVESAGLDSALAALPEERLRLRTKHVVTENDRVLQAVELLRAGDVAAIGQLLDASHRSLRDDYEVSCRELDVAVDSSVGAGALGARMVGGGFGGSAIALVREPDVDRVSAAVRTAFADAGWTEPRIFAAVPSAGAGRL